MTEDFLYFLWQFRYFRHLDLRTEEGQPLTIRHPGHRNRHSGPDFINARLLIGDVEWVGTVEAHLRTSDWQAHRHQHDQAYDNVILHLVWENDRLTPQCRTDGTPIPTLSLRHRTDEALLRRYEALLQESGIIPCAGRFGDVEPLRRTAMIDHALLQRLQRKAETVLQVFARTRQDWEETAYQTIAAAFGFGVNAEPFARLSRYLPLKIIYKHRDNRMQVEALLIGMAGLLDNPNETDDYLENLRREYRFLSVKYNLDENQLPAHVWKWGGLRPAGFPTLRLAQFAGLLSDQPGLMSLTLTEEPTQLLSHLRVVPSAYWQTHYRFGKPAARLSSTLGETAVHHLIINAIVPILAAYAGHRRDDACRDRAINLLESLPAEDNRVTRIWKDLSLEVRSAFDSQGAIELYTQFCQQKRCMSCQIGLSLIRRA